MLPDEDLLPDKLGLAHADEVFIPQRQQENHQGNNLVHEHQVHKTLRLSYDSTGSEIASCWILTDAA